MKTQDKSSQRPIPGSNRAQFPTYLTGPEVCRILQISPATFTRIIKRGDLPAMRVAHRQWRVQQKDLEAYIAERSSTAA